MTRTPVALLVPSSIRTSETIEFGPHRQVAGVARRERSAPSANGTPRSDRSRARSGRGPCSGPVLVGTPSVVTPARPGISWRPIFAIGALALLAAIELQRPLEDAVGQVRDVLLRARDAEQRVDLVVVGRDVGIADRPVLAEPVVALRLEV